MPDTLAIGDQAPALGIPDQDGLTVDLAAYRGRFLLVYFYPRDDTPGCTLEAKGFSALLAEFAALGVDIVGISGDSAASHCRFREKHGLAVRLLTDPEQAVQQAWGVWQLKKNYGKEYYGTVRSTFLVDREGRLAALWRNVRADGHAGAVLEECRRIIGQGTVADG